MSSARSHRVGLRGRGRGRAKTSDSNTIPDVFHDMLADDVSALNVEEPDRPRKRRRMRQLEDDQLVGSSTTHADQIKGHGGQHASMEFKDVPLEAQQTAYDDSADSSTDTDIAWEEVSIKNYELKSDNADEQSDLNLTLIAKKSTKSLPSITRRRTLGKEERSVRLGIHKMHILCLLSHVDRRNSWCNDSSIQGALKPLVTKEMLGCLQPNQNYTQFRRAESVKKGLAQVIKMWLSTFSITRRGMHRSFWTESGKAPQNIKLPVDADSLHEKAEFLVAAKELKGSRDVGTQLFCALLRGVGLDVRLVCSLQPLPFSANASAAASGVLQEPTIITHEPAPEASDDRSTMDSPSDEAQLIDDGEHISENVPSTRRRLGHPNAADYFMPRIATAPRPSPRHETKKIIESPYPTFWVEVLDEAHQKWIPVNPADGMSVANARKFEPPASDLENNMSCVIAFEDDGAAKDVTRRYTKNFNAKTRKMRVESTDGGDKWWRRVMRFYSRGWKSDLDQIEDTELAAAEAREPMPKSVSDFKGHPIYALERHLRRNEALVNPREVGRLATSRDASGGKKLEKVFRRSDVKTVKSADGWYRTGREIILGEQPVKVVAARSQPDGVDEESETTGTALYSEAQTELYEPPPIVDGRVPKNSYGNLDVYVPSMIPNGGVHIPHSEASRAANLLNVDYADAVTGFEFRGRHGTAVIRGIVAAAEYNDALYAVIEGFVDEQARAEEERRSLAALRLWRFFLVGLRIKERVDGYDTETDEKSHEERVEDTAIEDDSGMESEEYIDNGGGGFFPE